MTTTPRRLSVFLAMTLALAACNDDKKKDAPAAPRAPEAIPSDFVVNGFFPPGGEGQAKMEIRGDGGAVSVPLDASAAPTDPGVDDPTAAAGSAPASTVKLLEPGDEPRVARKYDFKTGKTENLSVTMRSTMTQEIPGQPPGTQTQPGMVFSLAMTPQAKADNGDIPIKVVISRAEILPGADIDPAQAKQMAQAFKMLAGQGGTFRLGPHGAVSGFALQNEQLQRSELAQLAQQTLDGMFVLLPDDPIGKNAKWEESSVARQDGVNVSSTSTFVLKDITADGLAITVTTKRKAPPQPMADPRAPKGTTVAIDGTTNSTLKIRTERMPGKGAVDSTTAIIISQAAAPGAPPGGRAMAQKVSVKQTIDNSTP